MCPYQNSCTMGQPMFHPNMPQWPWSQPAQPKSAPKPKKVKKPRLDSVYDEAVADLENLKRIRDLYDGYIKGIEENAIKKDKEKKDKDKPKKREGFNIPETMLLVIILSPFVAIAYKYMLRYLGL